MHWFFFVFTFHMFKIHEQCKHTHKHITHNEFGRSLCPFIDSQCGKNYATKREQHIFRRIRIILIAINAQQWNLLFNNLLICKSRLVIPLWIGNLLDFLRLISLHKLSSCNFFFFFAINAQSYFILHKMS